MKDSERLFERIDEYNKALARLRDVLAQPQNEYMRDALIKRFEFTYELAWKTLKLWLEFRDVEAVYPRDVFRASLQNGLIEKAEGWSEMQDKRNLTIHTYNEILAAEVADFIRRHAVPAFAELEQSLQRAKTES